MLELISLKSQGDRILTLTEATWEDYEQLIVSHPHYLISYLNQIVTIVAPGRNHERIATVISTLVNAYCRKYQIPYYTLGSKDIKKQYVAGKQPDTSYCFFTEKETQDLAIEVNYTSGSIDDLEKYRILEVAEVWIWQENSLKFYGLTKFNTGDRGDYYEELEYSTNLPHLSCDFLQPFVNRGLKDNNLAIENDFFSALDI
ncbi:MAG: Uma2 family endonuclease [Cyanobacteria bacterium P01_A01_bin.83]